MRDIETKKKAEADKIRAEEERVKRAEEKEKRAAEAARALLNPPSVKAIQQLQGSAAGKSRVCY